MVCSDSAALNSVTEPPARYYLRNTRPSRAAGSCSHYVTPFAIGGANVVSLLSIVAPSDAIRRRIHCPRKPSLDVLQKGSLSQHCG